MRKKKRCNWEYNGRMLQHWSVLWAEVKHLPTSKDTTEVRFYSQWRPAQRGCSSHKQILSSYVLCRQPYACTLSWEAEQEAEQQTVPFLPTFEEALCSQASRAPVAPGVQQLSLVPTGAVPQSDALFPGTSTLVAMSHQEMQWHCHCALV